MDICPHIDHSKEQFRRFRFEFSRKMKRSIVEVISLVYLFGRDLPWNVRSSQVPYIGMDRLHPTICALAIDNMWSGFAAQTSFVSHEIFFMTITIIIRRALVVFQNFGNIVL
jgi:hypothetical protein